MWKKIVSAIEDSDANLVNFYLVQNPGIVYEQNYQDETLLHFAAQNADLPTILELINMGARADTPDDFGWTPLHESCNTGNEAAVSLFIKTDIDLNQKTKKEETPLHLASRHNFHSILARLLNAGAKVDIKNKTGNTPLHIAARYGNAKSVEVLLAAGANVRACNLEGSTPLHLTATHGHTKCADLLLANHSDSEQLDSSGRNFMNIAEIFGHDKFLNLLRTKFPKLKESSTTKATQKMPAIVEKLSLENYFCDEQFSTSKCQSKTSIESIFRSLIFGKGSHKGYRNVLRVFETILWFVVFPLLLFILWEGFAKNILPPIISLDLTNVNPVNAQFLQTFANFLVVFVFSYLLVATEIESFSILYFFKDLREAVPFRVLHYALIEFHFYQQLVYNQEFFNKFAIFWLWFATLYSVSYMIWWANIHFASWRKEKVAEVCVITES